MSQTVRLSEGRHDSGDGDWSPEGRAAVWRLVCGDRWAWEDPQWYAGQG